MINCDKMKELMSDYLDNTLDSETRKSVEAHLQEDAACRKVYEDAKAIKGSMQNLPSISVSEDFHARLRTRIVEENNADANPIRNKRRTLSFAFTGTIASAALLFFIFTQNAEINNEGSVDPISSGKQDIQLNVTNKVEEKEASEADSSKTLPEQIDTGNMHLTGQK